MLYEIREYRSSAEGIDALRTRFEAVTFRVFERVGIELVAMFDNVDDALRLTYLVRFPDEAARSRAWSAFDADVEWQQAKAASEAEHGSLVLGSTSVLVRPTAASPLQ